MLIEVLVPMLVRLQCPCIASPGRLHAGFSIASCVYMQYSYCLVLYMQFSYCLVLYVQIPYDSVPYMRSVSTLMLYCFTRDRGAGDYPGMFHLLWLQHRAI